MNRKISSCLAAAAGALLLTATNGYTFGSFGDDVNSLCAPVAPYTGDCTLCHTTSSKGASHPGKTAYLTGGSALTDFFCPPAAPTCTDQDNDGFAVEGGDCGPVDCNDADAAVNPGAAENCSDSMDNNCNGLVDAQDPAAVGCLVCTDGDGDGYASEGGQCGPVDCDDTNAAINPGAADVPNNGADENCDGADTVDPTTLDQDGDGFTQAAGDCDDANAAINPGAVDVPNNGVDENCDGADSIDASALDNDADGFTPAGGDCDDTDGTINPNAIEVCTDGIDNDCNGLVDAQDSNAVDCPTTCTDLDGDTYAIEGNECGPVDCNDNDSAINPGSIEICEDSIDNNCDGAVDEGCDVTCADVDGDGYQDAACGGNDCNDLDAAINPGATEIPGNAVDENCNGSSDDTVLTCTDGSLLVVKKMEYRGERKQLVINGRATVGTTISIINADTGETLAEGITVSNKSAKWKAVLKKVRRNVRNITIVSSNGCEISKRIGRHVYRSAEDRDHDDRDDDRDDDRHDRSDD